MIQQTFSPLDKTGMKQWAFPESNGFDKNTLRKWMKEKRKTQDKRIASYKNNKIAQNLLSMPDIATAKTIGIYASMPEEADTDSIAAALLLQGKQLCYPVVAGKNLQFLSVKNLAEDLSSGGPFGIREPNPLSCQTADPKKIDVFIIPGLAFDIFGDRVGFGAGYYDRYLSGARPDARVIALAYDFQIVHTVPAGEHDIAAERIVSENIIYHPGISAYQSRSEEDTLRLAGLLYDNGLHQGGILVLHANLGTGKTVFVRGLAQKNCCTEDTASPTFIYCREYHGSIPLYHIDGYRVDSLQRSDTVFWEELLEQDGLIAVEWGEQLGSLIPRQAVHLYGTITENGERIWTVLTPLQSQWGLHNILNNAGQEA